MPIVYEQQTIEGRYIKKHILENYLNKHIKEFGSEWTQDQDRNSEKIVLNVGRALTKKEIKDLQKQSYPDKFEDEEEEEDADEDAQ